jgi:hypothetical protein
MADDDKQDDSWLPTMQLRWGPVLGEFSYHQLQQLWESPLHGKEWRRVPVETESA